MSVKISREDLAKKAEVYDFACPDWIDRLKAGHSLVPDLPLDQAEATRAVKIFNKLKLPDVPGQPSMEEGAGEWFRDIVSALFGSVDDEGARQVGEIFALVPKKNSKTTGGAAIMLTALLINKRQRAEFLLIGPTQDIADTAFQQVVGMIEADPVLNARFHPTEHKKTIIDRITKARLRIKTFDMKVMTGVKPVGVLVDELHIMSSMSYASRVMGQIRGGLIPNPESFLVIITTQSDTIPTGVFKSELQYARGVRDGRIKSARMLPVLYEFPEEMQIDERKPWRDPKYWPMVLPNLELSITIDRLIADFDVAKEKGEEEERRWASQHLNIEIGLAMHAERWLGADYWLSAAMPGLTLEGLIEQSDVVVAGIDGGGLDDLLGLGVIGRQKDTRIWLHWGKAWAQPEVLSRRKEIAERLHDLELQGQLVMCKSATQDIIEVADIIELLHSSGKLPEKGAVGLDPYGIAALVDELSLRGLSDDQLQGIGQGSRLSPAVWGLERKLKDGTFRHAGQEIMAWVVGNAKAEQRGNAVIITKESAGKGKIDPLIALFNAAMLMSRNPEGTGHSIYETRGMLVV